MLFLAQLTKTFTFEDLKVLISSDYRKTNLLKTILAKGQLGDKNNYLKVSLSIIGDNYSYHIVNRAIKKRPFRSIFDFSICPPNIRLNFNLLNLSEFGEFESENCKSCSAETRAICPPQTCRYSAILPVQRGGWTFLTILPRAASAGRDLFTGAGVVGRLCGRATPPNRAATYPRKSDVPAPPLSFFHSPIQSIGGKTGG